MFATLNLKMIVITAVTVLTAIVGTYMVAKPGAVPQAPAAPVVILQQPQADSMEKIDPNHHLSRPDYRDKEADARLVGMGQHQQALRF